MGKQCIAETVRREDWREKKGSWFKKKKKEEKRGVLSLWICLIVCCNFKFLFFFSFPLFVSVFLLCSNWTCATLVCLGFCADATPAFPSCTSKSLEYITFTEKVLDHHFLTLKFPYLSFLQTCSFHDYCEQSVTLTVGPELGLCDNSILQS